MINHEINHHHIDKKLVTSHNVLLLRCHNINALGHLLNKLLGLGEIRPGQQEKCLCALITFPKMMNTMNVLISSRINMGKPQSRTLSWLKSATQLSISWLSRNLLMRISRHQGHGASIIVGEDVSTQCGSSSSSSIRISSFYFLLFWFLLGFFYFF